MRAFLFIFLLLLTLATQLVHASVRVAFFQMRSPQGNLVRLEPGGRFFHVALQLADGRWIQSHPRNGTEFVWQLSQIGPDAEILENLSAPGIPVIDVVKYIGAPFDFKFNWDDPRSSYCSKLVGNILGIDPRPMSFSARIWKNKTLPGKGSVGLSPDDLYEILKGRDFSEGRPMVSCASSLANRI